MNHISHYGPPPQVLIGLHLIIHGLIVLINYNQLSFFIEPHHGPTLSMLYAFSMYNVQSLKKFLWKVLFYDSS